MEISPSERLVLYAEDDDNDVFFVTRAFGKINGPKLTTVSSGSEAIDYLMRSLRGETKTPFLVLLDLNLPHLTGHEVLHWIRQQAPYADLPTVVFTSSAQPSDIVRAYGAGATAYVTKPNTPKRMIDFAGLVTQLGQTPREAARLFAGFPEFRPMPGTVDVASPRPV